MCILRSLLKRTEDSDIEVSFDDFADSVLGWYDEPDGSAPWVTLDSNDD